MIEADPLCVFFTRWFAITLIAHWLEAVSVNSPLEIFAPVQPRSHGACLASCLTFSNRRIVLAIRNTVIKEFKTLNNMLAFINTLPGMLTFKSPHYDAKGLPLHELSASLTFAGGDDGHEIHAD